MKKYLFAGAAAVLMAACLIYALTGGRGEVAEADGRPKVIAAIFPQYDFARAVGGDKIALSLLLRPGMESHSYSPSPQDIINIQNCDLFIYIGGENDRWADKIIASFDGDKGPRVLKLIDSVSAVKEELVEGMQREEEAHGEEVHEHDHRVEYDEHIWTSPRNAEKMTSAIAEELAVIDPQNRSFYEERGKAYIAELERLDKDFRRMVSEASRRRVVFGDRFPFRYLADEYGIAYSAAFPGCAAESEADAATVAYLIDKVRAENIPVVFHIEMSNEKTADAICQETGAQKRLLHSCHNLSRAEIDGGASYISLMRKNLEALKEALN
ncbi:MAG: metal ABC transporter substrate-binding protein [Synergistaceae bacterium]|nr:metal ABC transporter substrate-binding protein [Synergistaceae bacterium]